MNLFEFEGKRPVVHPEAFVAATATLIGDVTVEAGASIWYGAVLRGDICTIVVRAGSNIQDNSVLHAAPGETLEVGPDATVGHGCVVHGRAVEEKALVGNGSTLLDGSVVGPGTLVAAGSVRHPRHRAARRHGRGRHPVQADQADRRHVVGVLGRDQPDLLPRAGDPARAPAPSRRRPRVSRPARASSPTPVRSQNDHFRRLWVANIVTVIGAQLTVVAVPAQIYADTGSSAYVGLTGVFGLVPLVVFGLWGGALADVFDRRTILICTTIGLIVTSAPVLGAGRARATPTCGCCCRCSRCSRRSSGSTSRPARRCCRGSWSPSCCRRPTRST